MKAMPFSRTQTASRAARDGTLLHPEYPIEQTFCSRDPEIQRQLMQHAWHRPIPDHAMFVADYNGLRVLGRSECALDRVTTALRDRFWALQVDSPSVRYAFGAPVLEPYMTVLIKGPIAHLPGVRDDLVQRRGRITRISERGDFVLEAEAPLAALLGYKEWLKDLFSEEWEVSYVGIWLSRYLPIDDDNGPQAA